MINLKFLSVEVEINLASQKFKELQIAPTAAYKFKKFNC